MSKPFNHFVITRFNLKQSIWGSDKLGAQVNSDVWLKSRYELFETYCFPSLQNQTNKDFKWLVFFDETTPQIYRDKNTALNTIFKNFIPIYVKNFETFHITVPQFVKDHSEKGVNYVITTRLDNDDCFHKDAVKTIQDHFTTKETAIIDLCNGLTLQTTPAYKLALREHVISGPFISLCESLKPSKNPVTVYKQEHTAWLGEVTYISVNKGFYWLQIIHDRNISNALGKQLTYNKRYLEGFDFLGSIPFSLRYYIFILYKKIRRLVKHRIRNKTNDLNL
ncbi:glycosyltransferase [Seonamhaeicola aphaedonensis]|uniref:Putative rhamnosyltransferase n=1 Tax=Seonamhaeicola aphaedonensis TaxID=1461338 RepID=A0A3D9HFX8_9FLAO|nr:glycosyltransferase [Seonamhaeicola aphaedonensis]RED48383.1 putative rhamnosyltransferase [Seonamhaeicola aphaedonensis]